VPRRLLQLLKQALDSQEFWHTQAVVAACGEFWAVVVIPAAVVIRPDRQDSLSQSCAQQFEQAGLQQLMQVLLDRAMQLLQSQPQAAPLSASGSAINTSPAAAAGTAIITAAAAAPAAATAATPAAAAAAAAAATVPSAAAAAAAAGPVAACQAPVSSRLVMLHVDTLLRFCRSLFSMWPPQQAARSPTAPPLLPLAQLTLAARQYVSNYLQQQQTLAATAGVAAAASPVGTGRYLWEASTFVLLLIYGTLASSGEGHPEDIAQPPAASQSPCFLQCLFHLLVDHTFTAFLPPAHRHSSSHSQCFFGICHVGEGSWQLDASSSWQVACSADADVPRPCTQLLTLLGLTPEAVLWGLSHDSYGCPALAALAVEALPAARSATLLPGALLRWQQLPPEVVFMELRLHQLLPCLLLHWVQQCTGYSDLPRSALDAVLNVLWHTRQHAQDHHVKLAAVVAAQEQQQQWQVSVSSAEQQQQQQREEDAPAQQVQGGVGSICVLLPAGAAADMLRSLCSMQLELLLQLNQHVDSSNNSSSDDTGGSLTPTNTLYDALDQIAEVVLMLAVDLDTQLAGGSLRPGCPAAAAAAAAQLIPTQAAAAAVLPVAVEASAAAVDADLCATRQAAAGWPKDARVQVRLIYPLLDVYVRNIAHNSALNMEATEGETHPLMHPNTYDAIERISEAVNCKLQQQPDAPEVPQLVKGIHSRLLQRYGPSEAATPQLYRLLCSLVKLCLHQTHPYQRGILYAVAAATQEVLASVQRPALVDPAATGAADAAVVQTEQLQAPQRAAGASSHGTAQTATAAGDGHVSAADTVRQAPADHLQQQAQQSPRAPSAAPAVAAAPAAAPAVAAPALFPLPWLVLLGRCCILLTDILFAERSDWLYYEEQGDNYYIVAPNGTAEQATASEMPEGAPPPPAAAAAGTAGATATATAAAEEAGAGAAQDESDTASVSYQQSFLRAPLRRLIGSIQANILADCPAWLHWEPLAAELAAAGGATATALQQKHVAAVHALEAAMTGLRVPGSTAAATSLVAEAGACLTAFAASLMSIPTSHCCNNPGCVNTAGPSEQQLVGGRSCVCGGCRTARYCGKACQAKHWQSHKVVCRALAARKAAANAAAACPAGIAAE